MPNEIGDDNLVAKKIGDDNLVPNEIGDDNLVPTEIGDENLVPSEIGHDNLVPKKIGDDSLVPSEIGSDYLAPSEIGDENLVPYVIGCENLAPKSDPAPDESLEGDDDGDGTTEWASLAVQGQVRVMKDCLELKLRTATPPEARHADQKDNEDLTAHQEIRGKTFDVQETVYDEAVVFKPHKAEGHVKDAAPQRRDGIWSDFNSRSHEHIVSGEGEIVPYETIHRKKPENVRSKQLVPDLKCALLSLKGGDAATGHMVAEVRRERQTGEPLGLIGKRSDIAESSVDEFGAATYGCRRCLASGVASTEACRARLTERLLNAPEHPEK